MLNESQVAHGLTRVAPRVLPDEGRVKGVLMMKLRSEMLTVAGAVLAGIGLGVFGNTVVGEAYYTDPATALSHAPQGLQVHDQGYFEVPSSLTDAQGNTVNNSASVLEGSKADAVQLSTYGDKYTNTGGAVWSKSPNFDLYQNQRASMWVYAGGGMTSDDLPGSGFAFVLQNSGASAFSGSGESLGVWGVDPRSTSVKDLGETAIQHSWALEFDTNVNQKIPAAMGNLADKTNAPSAFDMGEPGESNGKDVYYGWGFNPGDENKQIQQQIIGQHIASGYPADSSTYKDVGTVSCFNGYGGVLGTLQLGLGNYHYYSQEHYGLLKASDSSAFIADGAWHHITVDYTAPVGTETEGTMAYSFDDKDPKTGASKSTEWFAKQKISPEKLGASSTNPNVYWGFTGSTGYPTTGQSGSSGTETSMVVFEQVPNEADVNATSELTDEKTGTVVDSSHPVSGNDQVKLTYKLNYENGNVDWKTIKSSLNLPANIVWSKGQISYSDNSKDDVLNVADISNDKLDISVQNLNKNKKQAVITLEGKVNNIKATDAAVTTSFNGSNAIASATLDKFNINQRSFSMSIDDASKDINVNANTPAKITGTFSANDTKVTAENTKVAARLTSKDGTVTDIDSDKIPIVKNGDGSYSFTIPVDKVPAGDTAVDVVATSSVSSGYTDEDTAKLHGGTVTFGATSGKIIFKKTVLTGKGTTISRDDSNGPWSLNVDSSLASGAWTLSARTTGMHSVNVPSQALDGNLIYKNGDDVTTLNAVDSPIMTSPQSTGTPTETNIASDWTNDSGILLDVNGGAVSDDYIGEITWTLGSVPKVN